MDSGSVETLSVLYSAEQQAVVVPAIYSGLLLSMEVRLRRLGFVAAEARDEFMKEGFAGTTEVAPCYRTVIAGVFQPGYVAVASQSDE
jgi:hypothetical protein